MAWPHVFATLSGTIPASYLDDNFNAAAAATDLANLTTAVSGLQSTVGAVINATTNNVTCPAQFSLTGFINPTPATGGYVNDYAPTGYDSAGYVRLASTAGAVFITGYAAGTSVRGRTFILENSTGQAVTLIHASPSSLSANRLFLPNSASLTMGLGHTVAMTYTGGGWRVMSVSGGRDALIGPRTYYVNASTGNDANDGLSTSTALLTVQQAVNLAAKLDLQGNTVTIQCAAGTYPGSVFLSGALVGQSQASNFVVVGDNTTPSNVVFSYSGSGSNVFSLIQGARMSIQGITFSGGASLFAFITASVGARVEFQNCAFGQSGSYQLYSYGPGTSIEAVGPYKITAGAPGHLCAQGGGMIRNVGQTVTITGTPAFSSQFVLATSVGYIEYTGITFSGSATGNRYLASGNGVIYTASGGASYFPGSIAGGTATGGQYT